MKMSELKFREHELDDAVYCRECDDVVDYGLEPDATPDNSPEFECPSCGKHATSYGVESAMVAGLIEISSY